MSNTCGITYRGKVYQGRLGDLVKDEHFKVYETLDNRELTEKRDGKLYLAKNNLKKQNALLTAMRKINITYPKPVVRIDSTRRVIVDIRKIDELLADQVAAENRVAANESSANEFFNAEGDVQTEAPSDEFYELESSVNTPPIAALDAKMKAWLRAAGVDYKKVASIKNRKGEPVSAVAKADMLKSVVEYVDDKYGVSTLPEEAAHFLVELLGMDHPLMKKMLTDIVRRPEYTQVKEEYKDIYTDELDFKKEAIGKMIAAEAVSEFVGTPHESWWARVKYFLANTFKKLSPSTIDESLAPYKEAATLLLNEDISENTQTVEELAEIMENSDKQSEFFESVDVNASQQQIIKQITDGKVELVNGIYTNKETKVEIKNRVSDIINRFRRSMNMKSYDNPVPAHIGTVLHTYMEVLINKQTTKTRASDAQVYREVAEKLKDSEIPKEFWSVPDTTLHTLRQGTTQLLKGINARQEAINKELGITGDAVVLTEQVLSSKNNDLAGTADVITVYSDGSVGVYDFKSFNYTAQDRKYNNEVFNVDKVTQWNIQMSNYVDLLREGYGVTKFRETRIVPIGTETFTVDKKTKQRVDAKGISYAMMDVGSETKAALEHVPLLEELTGHQNTDRAVKKLIALRKSLIAEKRGQTFLQKKKADVKLRTIDKSLKALRLHRDISTLNNAAFELTKTVRAAMVVTEPADARYLVPARISELIQELSVYEEIISTGSGELNDEISKNQTLKLATGKVKASEILTVMGYIHSTKQDLMNLMTQRASDAAGEDLTTVARAQGGLVKKFLGVAAMDSPIFRRLTSLFTQKRDESENETFEAIDMIKAKHKALQEWAKGKGMSMTEVFDKIVNPESKTLVSQHSKQYWLDFDKAKENKDVKWFKENTQFLEDVYNKHLDEHNSFFDDPLFNAAAYFGMRQHPGEHLNAFNTRVANKVQDTKDKFVERLDVRKHESAYFTTWKDIIRPVPSSKYTTSEYEYIQANKPLKEYYDMYVDMNENFSKKAGKNYNIGRNFIAHIAQDTLDRASELGPIKGVSEIGKSMLHSVMVREEDAILGKVDQTTGERIRGVPLLYADDIRVPISGKEKAAIEAEMAAAYGKDTSDYKKFVEDAVIAKEYEKGRKIKSVDLTKSLIMMTKSVNHYAAMREIEEDVKSLRQILVEGDTEETLLDANGEALKSNIDKSLIKRLGVDKGTIAHFDSVVDYLLYGVNKEDGLVVDVAGKKLSGTKILGGLHNYLSVKALGLNPILGFASYIGASSNMLMMAAEGRVFSKEDLKEASSSLSVGPYGKSSKSDEDRALVSILRPTARDLSYEEAEATAATFASRHFTGRNMFMFHRKGDDNIDNKLAVAISNSHVIDEDGVIRHRDKAKNKKAKSIREHTKMVDGKGVVQFDGKDYFKENPVQYTKLRNKIRKTAFNIKGSISEEHRGQINASWMGQMLMKFRTWMPGLIQARMAGVHYDSTLEQVEMGRFKVFLGNLFQNGMIPRLDVLGGTLMGIINSKFAMGTINKEYTQQLMEQFFEENPGMRDKGLTEEEFLRMQEAKVRGMLSEVRILLAFAMILAVLDWGDWDDRNESNLFTRNAYLAMRRSYLEISFFLDPASPMDILKYPLPVMSIIQSVGQIFSNTSDEVRDSLVGENKKGDTTGYGYYTLKAVPVANQVLSLFAFFNASRHETGSWNARSGKEQKPKEDKK